MHRLEVIVNYHAGGYDSAKDDYLTTAMTLKMEKDRPMVSHNLKFLKNARAGAATVFYEGNL